jgi:hypothetical protein
VSTTVLLEVSIGDDADPHTSVAPPDVLAAVAGAGQPIGHGWSRRSEGPWRLRFHLTGPDRVTAGQALEKQLRSMGYAAELLMAH